MIDKKEIEGIKKYAKSKGLITVSVGTYHKWCDKNISCNCLEWIEYFKNADEVITDTFHGTIVSVIMKKPIAVYIRSNINENKLLYLTRQLEITNRKIQEIAYEELSKVFEQKVNYEEVTKKVQDIRDESEKYLINSINKERE